MASLRPRSWRATSSRQVHVAVVPGTDFGVPQDLRLAFCNERYNEAIDRLREYFTTSITDRRSSHTVPLVEAAASAGA